jgi:hypothetical protein
VDREVGGALFSYLILRSIGGAVLVEVDEVAYWRVQSRDAL